MRCDVVYYVDFYIGFLHFCLCTFIGNISKLEEMVLGVFSYTAPVFLLACLIVWGSNIANSIKEVLSVLF